MADDRSKKSSQTPAKASFLATYAGGFLLAAAVCVLCAIIAYGSTLKANGPFVTGFVLIGMACLIAWFVGRSSQAAVPRDQWARQRSLGGANSAISTLLFLVALIGINYIAARRHKTFDLTSNKVNMLAEQSVKALQKLAGPVTLTYVYGPIPDPAVTLLLDKYKNGSDKIHVDYLNAMEEPTKYQALGLASNARQVVLLQGTDAKSGPRQQIEIIDEQNMTSALMKIGEQKTRVFYHLIGHGEGSLDAGSRASFSLAKEKLSAQGYIFKHLNLATTKGGIPKDASVVAALGPTSDLSAAEEKMLADYVAGKGRLLVQLTPMARPLPQWRALAKSLGVTVLDGFVAETDPQRYLNSPQVPIVPITDVTKHAVLGGVGQNTNVVFPGVTPMKVASPPPPGLSVTAVLESSAVSKSAPFERGGSMADGPFALLATCERAAAPGVPLANDMRAVFVGSGQLGDDTNFTFSSDGDMFLSAVNWVAGNELLVSIPPKQPVRNTLDMSPTMQRFSYYFSLITLPVSVLLMGGLVWWKRR